MDSTEMFYNVQSKNVFYKGNLLGQWDVWHVLKQRYWCVTELWSHHAFCCDSTKKKNSNQNTFKRKMCIDVKLRKQGRTSRLNYTRLQTTTSSRNEITGERDDLSKVMSSISLASSGIFWSPSPCQVSNK